MNWNKKLAALLFALLLPVQGWALDDGGAWKINMKKADIRTFIEQVSDITGYSFIVDPRVKGEVTVVSNTEMSSADIYDMFESVLRIHGYAAVKTGQVVKIVPTQGAKQENLPLTQNPGAEGNDRLVTRVVNIENAEATELVPILRPMVPQYGHLAAVRSANALIISDHASNIERMLEIIKRVDNAESEEVEVVQLEHAWVGDLVKTLEQLTPVQTGVSAGKNSTIISRGSTPSVRVVADERTNRLILRGERAGRERIKGLVKQLDRPTESSGSTKVIYLRHADAVSVAEVLNGLVNGISASGSSASSGSTSSITRTTTIGSRRLNTGSSSGSSDSGVTIQADESLNALIVRAAPAEMAEIKSIIDQLDVRRAQVLIEAAFVEVSGSSSDAIGVQWGYGDPQEGVAGTNFSTAGASLGDIYAGYASDDPSVLSSISGLLLGGATQSGDVKLGVVIQAVESNNNTNLLSTPSIMTLDNEEAEIIVGENVPFITGTTLSESNANPFQTIERQDVGLTLRVTPQINDGDVVRLQLEQEVSNVNPQQIQGSADISTQKRSVKSVILANNKEIIVTGGLVRDDVNENIAKVPLLGDIPLLGALFRTRSQEVTKRNLLLFLQPTIIRTDQDANDVSLAKYEQMRTLSFAIDNNGNVNRVQDPIFPSDPKKVLRHGLRFGEMSEADAEAELDEADADVYVEDLYGEDLYQQ